MNVVRALNAQVERGRRVGGVSDAYVVIVANFGCLGIACVRTALALADERNEIVWKVALS